MNSVSTLVDLSGQAPADPTGDLIELRQVGIGQVFVDFHQDLPSFSAIGGIVLFALNYMAFHAVAFPKLPSHPNARRMPRPSGRGILRACVRISFLWRPSAFSSLGKCRSTAA